MDHRRSSSYNYGTTHDVASHHTSSAFSASAQPDEDWTKISDLAERRRIQNRIAQRNYRKKLKRRLEDLERKAASTSPSPEQKPVDLATKNEKSRSKSSSLSSQRKRQTSSPKRHEPLPAVAHHAPIAEDWSMFSSQHTRQLTTSPPPFAYPAIDPTQTPPSPQLPGGAFPVMSDLYYQYPQSMHEDAAQFQWQDKLFATKQEGGLDGEVAPLYLNNFAPYGGSNNNNNVPDVAFASNFQDPCLTPELCDLYEYSSAGSPAEFNAFPQTPMIMPLTPPYHSFDQ